MQWRAEAVGGKLRLEAKQKRSLDTTMRSAGCLGGHNSGAYRRGGTIRPYVAMTGYGSKCMGTPP
jgi:hypothetical protein